MARKIWTSDLTINSQVLYHYATPAGLNDSFWVQITKYAEQCLGGFEPPISQSIVECSNIVPLPLAWMTIFEYKLKNMLRHGWKDSNLQSLNQ